MRTQAIRPKRAKSQTIIFRGGSYRKRIGLSAGELNPSVCEGKGSLITSRRRPLAGGRGNLLSLHLAEFNRHGLTYGERMGIGMQFAEAARLLYLKHITIPRSFSCKAETNPRQRRNHAPAEVV